MAFTTDKCFQAKAGEVARDRYEVDAATFTRHTDTGDFIVVTNAEKIKVTGRKAEEMFYDSYSYYPGGRKVVGYAEMLRNHPDRVIMEAVRRMLPKSALGRRQLTKLKVYRGADHPHQAQNCQNLDLTKI